MSCLLDRAHSRRHLRLQFDGELLHWLADAGAEDAATRQQLLWLHQLRMEQYGECGRRGGSVVAFNE